MAQLDKLLHICAEGKFSDLHIAAGLPMMARRLGELQPMSSQTPTAAHIQALIYEILTPEQRQIFEEIWEVDSVYQTDQKERFRFNVFKEQRGVSAVFRHIPNQTRTFEELGLPPVIEKFCLATQGLIIVAGPASSGKTATLASIIDHINTNRNEHIITIEDPIEYLHQNKLSVLSQRGLGLHTRSFDSALRAALREDPDVIMVGEVRDTETMNLAMTAAETGHLVLTTLHTQGAMATVNRVLNLFPQGEQARAQGTLSECLLGVISQQLVKNAAEDNMIPVFEVLVNTLSIANVIREGESYKIDGMLQMASRDGMKTMSQSLEELYKKGLITRKTLQEYGVREEQD